MINYPIILGFYSEIQKNENTLIVDICSGGPGAEGIRGTGDLACEPSGENEGRERSGELGREPYGPSEVIPIPARSNCH